jgi:hypothetical protein
MLQPVVCTGFFIASRHTRTAPISVQSIEIRRARAADM